MEEKKYHPETLAELISNVVSTFAMTKAKHMMATKENTAIAIKAAMTPFVNLHNIGLFISNDNITKIRGFIINALPKLDKHYIFHIEPTPNNQDLFWQISYRPDGGTDALVLPVTSGYLSELTQEQIFSIIQKFLPNGNGTATVTDGQ